jgi:hypothetical protein
VKSQEGQLTLEVASKHPNIRKLWYLGQSKRDNKVFAFQWHVGGLLGTGRWILGSKNTYIRMAPGDRTIRIQGGQRSAMLLDLVWHLFRVDRTEFDRYVGTYYTA